MINGFKTMKVKSLSQTMKGYQLLQAHGQIPLTHQKNMMHDTNISYS